MPETHFDAWAARTYASLWPELYEPTLVGRAVDRLAELAGEGPALEFGVGTGRIALPLLARGIPVHGIELSAAMLDELRRQPAGGDVEATRGAFARPPSPGRSPWCSCSATRSRTSRLRTSRSRVSVTRRPICGRAASSW